ncbi:MAG: guanylate kinase [Deltaproteobacteria bacterium]|nr:guanylate kinase [Deltaproteobacteria bacterium]
MKMKGVPFIVSAPSGAGKTTLCKKAVAFFPGLRHSISYTTRPPRAGEVNGEDYRFIENSEFDRMVEAGEFLEYAGVHGKRYGTSRKDLLDLLEKGIDVILDIDVQGAEKTRGRLLGGVYIFILPPSVEACEERLKTRAKDSPEEIKKRLKIALDEIKKAPEYQYIIINDDLGTAFEKLKSIIISEKARSQRMMGKVKELFGVDKV